MNNNSIFKKSLTVNRPEIYAVTSGKGGVGKTSLSVNLSILASQLNKKVLLVDADIHLGNVDLLLGIQPKYTIADVLSEKVELKDIIEKGPANLDILPAASAVDNLLASEDKALNKIRNSFSQIEKEYDMIFVDTAAGIHNTVMSFVLGADKIILVVTPDPSSIADGYGMIKIIKNNKIEAPVIMISNSVESDESGWSLFKKMNLMVQRFLSSEIVWGGSLLKDEEYASAVRKRSPLAIDSPQSSSISHMKVILRHILELKTDSLSNKNSNLFDRFMQNRHFEIGA